MVEDVKPKKLCDVIVPTYNKLEHTQKFVKSFLAQTSTPSRVIFVDNGSGDGTREYLTTLQDTDTHSFTIILNNENKGFILASNQGLHVSDAPYVCFCNNDVIFTHGWLDEIIMAFKENPDVGLLNPSSNNLNNFPNKGETIDEFAERLKRTYAKGSFVDMPYCIGFCMILRRSTIERVGGLSEEFVPMFFEDSDYSKRVYKAGLRLGCARRAYVWHHEHASLGQLGKEKEIIFKINRDKFHKKWGRALRVAWVVQTYEELLKELGKAVDMARDANFIWFWVKGLQKESKDIFKEADLHEISDVKFIAYNNTFSIFWKALTKKKKYDLIITKNAKLRYFLALIGQRSVSSPDPSRIKELKFKGV